MKLLLDLREAAEALGVDYETARGFIHSGALRAVRLDGRRKIQVSPRAIEDFISRSEVVPVVDPVFSRKPPKLTRKPQGQKLGKLEKPLEIPWYRRVQGA